jgi:hypothetical protein
MYHQARKTVLCNGQQTDWVPVKSGVPQGCPFSCYIFVLSIEPLHEHMRKTKNCEGITLPNGQQLKTSGFADDTALYISNPDAYFEFKKALDLYCDASGAKLNWSKCVGVGLGGANALH